jgi:hypothetical protein
MTTDERKMAIWTRDELMSRFPHLAPREHSAPDDLFAEGVRAETNARLCKIKSSRDSYGGKYHVTITQYVHDVTLGKDVVWSVRKPGYLRRAHDDRADLDSRMWSAIYEDAGGQEYSLGQYHYGRAAAEFAVACQFMQDEERRIADELQIAARLADVLYPGTGSAELRSLREELLSGDCSPAAADAAGAEIIAHAGW